MNIQKTQSTKTKRKPTQKKSNTKLEKTSLVENNTKEVKLGGSSSGNARKTESSQINGSSVAERTFQHFAGCHVSGDYTLRELAIHSNLMDPFWETL